jgi:hypothetical protein
MVDPANAPTRVRAGSTERVVRYVLADSLVLVIVGLIISGLIVAYLVR